MATYTKHANVHIGLYMQTESGYKELVYCYGSGVDSNSSDFPLNVELNSTVYEISTQMVSSYNSNVNLYIKIDGTIDYIASGVNTGITSSDHVVSSDGTGTVIMNFDSLTYVSGDTYFNYCNNNSMFRAYINKNNGLNYNEALVIDNPNDTGNSGKTAIQTNSGSNQIYIPKIINTSSISYKVTATVEGSERQLSGSFESKYIQVGRLNYFFGNYSTDVNYKCNPSIVSNGKFYFNKIPITAFSLQTQDIGEGSISVSVQCTAGSNINDSNYASKPITFNYLRPEIKLNSNLNLNFCCNPELTSTNLYYIGTEKLTNTDLVPATEWAKIIFKNSNTYKFDGISYFYLDIKNYEDLLNSAGDSYNTGKLEFTASTDSSSNYAPYSITLYMINFSGDGVGIETSPFALLNSHIKKRIPYLAYYNNSVPTYNSINGHNGFSPSDMFYRAGENYDTTYKVKDGSLIVLKEDNEFICSSTNYNNTSRSITASLNISDIVEVTSADTREHPSIISYLCEIVYLPDKPESGSEHNILIHESETYNMFKEYHIINIAMPRTLAESTPLTSPVTTIKDYITLLQENYPSFDSYDINHNITTILNTYDDPDDDTGNTVLSKKVFTDLLFYDNPATGNLTEYADGLGKLVTGYNINTGTNINKSIFFDLTKNAVNEWFTDKTTYQNTLIANLFGSGSGDDYSKVINWPVGDMFIYWCTDRIDSTTKTNWKSFNFNTPISKNTNFSLMACSYIDDNTDKHENFQTTENTYRNLSFTIPDQSNYANIVTT